MTKKKATKQHDYEERVFEKDIISTMSSLIRMISTETNTMTTSIGLRSSGLLVSQTTRI